MVFNGRDYSQFAKFWKYLLDIVGGTDLKDRDIKPGGNNCINLKALLLFGTLSICPDEDQEPHEWSMEDMMDQHDADRPDCTLSAHARAMLLNLDSELFDAKTRVQVVLFMSKVKKELRHILRISRNTEQFVMRTLTA